MLVRLVYIKIAGMANLHNRNLIIVKKYIVILKGNTIIWKIRNYLHYISNCFIPIRSFICPLTKLLYIIDKHTTARCFATHHQKTSYNLPYSRKKRIHIDGYDRETIKQSKEDSNCKRVTFYKLPDYFHYSCLPKGVIRYRNF